MSSSRPPIDDHVVSGSWRYLESKVRFVTERARSAAADFSAPTNSEPTYFWGWQPKERRGAHVERRIADRRVAHRR